MTKQFDSEEVTRVDVKHPSKRPMAIASTEQGIGAAIEGKVGNVGVYMTATVKPVVRRFTRSVLAAKTEETGKPE